MCNFVLPLMPWHTQQLRCVIQKYAPDAVVSASFGKTLQRFSWFSEEAPNALKSGGLKP